ncbi:MAG: type VI secretion system tip protein TssI/VgrG [Pirellulaceae bacterium]|nr:type VI secretion system tip protein TssI/VgrG [Pirellulaceae bacterium]
MAAKTGIHFVHASFQGEDLAFVSLEGVEELGRPYSYTVTFCCDTAIELDADDFLGQGMSAEINRDEKSRFFHGVIASFHQGGQYLNFTKYHVELVPSLWLATQKSDCRIFQNKTVPEIVDEVLGSDKPKKSLSGQHPKIPYCTQYRESDFDFVNRLFEYEGIYYRFSHEKGKHEMTLVDSNANAKEIPGTSTLPFRSQARASDDDHMSAWQHRHRIRSGNVSMTDFDFEKPDSELESKANKKLKYKNSDMAVFDYPGRYLESSRGEKLSEIRLNEILSGQEQIEGVTNSAFAEAGLLFKLKDHPTKTENGEYLIVKTVTSIHSAEMEPGSNKENVFNTRIFAVRKSQEFYSRRQTPKPFVRGPQTAIVVGKKGEEIWTDKYGRIKVQFHWDRAGKKDENSSCWIRVSQAWAGKSWGAIQLPRMVQEVIVEFLEGDPDQPIITGRVYNANMPVPYELPKNQTQSGVISRSTKKGSTKNFNELRFEDKKDSEEIYFHAEKDFSRVVENDDKLEVGLEKKDKGNQTITIHNDRTVTLKEGNDLLGIEKGNLTTNVDEGDLTTNVKKGDLATNVDKGDVTTTVKSGDHTTNVKSGDFTAKVDAGKVLIKAAKEITLQVGGSKIVVSPSSVKISAATVTVEGKTKAEVKGAQVSVAGQMKAEVKGTMVDVAGSGITQVKGAMVKIN